MMKIRSTSPFDLGNVILCITILSKEKGEVVTHITISICMWQMDKNGYQFQVKIKMVLFARGRGITTMRAKIDRKVNQEYNKNTFKVTSSPRSKKYMSTKLSRKTLIKYRVILLGEI